MAVEPVTTSGIAVILIIMAVKLAMKVVNKAKKSSCVSHTEMNYNKDCSSSSSSSSSSSKSDNKKKKHKKHKKKHKK